MYAAELGVDPQADFAHRPESQGQLGSAVSCFPSGASRVLDRHTHLEGYYLYISTENKLHQSKNQPAVRGGAPPRKQSGIKLGRQWLAPYRAFPALSSAKLLQLFEPR